MTFLRLDTIQEAEQLLGKHQVRKARVTKQAARLAIHEGSIGQTDLPEVWSLSFALPWPVSTNALYIPVVLRTRSGQIVYDKQGQPKCRMVLSKAGRAYKKLAVETLHSQRPHFGQSWLPISLPVALTLEFYRDSRDGYDVDNLRKVTQDALETAGILVNDRQVYEAHEHKRLSVLTDRACVMVTLRAWET